MLLHVYKNKYSTVIGQFLVNKTKIINQVKAKKFLPWHSGYMYMKAFV